MIQPTVESEPNPDALQGIQNLLSACKTSLRSSRDFTREALRGLVLADSALHIPSDKIHPASTDGRVLVFTHDLEDAAADSFFNGDHPTATLRFRIGLDFGSSPATQTYGEIEVECPSPFALKLRYRERDTKDRQPESMNAPSWTELTVHASDQKPWVDYHDGAEEQEERTTDLNIALPKGQQLIEYIQEKIL